MRSSGASSDQAALDRLVADLRGDRPVTVDAGRRGAHARRDRLGCGPGCQPAGRARGERQPAQRPRFRGALEPADPAPTSRSGRSASATSPSTSPRRAASRPSASTSTGSASAITDDVLPMGAFMQCRRRRRPAHDAAVPPTGPRRDQPHRLRGSSFDEVIVGGQPHDRARLAGGAAPRAAHRRLQRLPLRPRPVRRPRGVRLPTWTASTTPTRPGHPRPHPPHHLWTLQTNRDGEE